MEGRNRRGVAPRVLVLCIYRRALLVLLLRKHRIVSLSRPWIARCDGREEEVTRTRTRSAGRLRCLEYSSCALTSNCPSIHLAIGVLSAGPRLGNWETCSSEKEGFFGDFCPLFSLFSFHRQLTALEFGEDVDVDVEVDVKEV